MVNNPNAKLVKLYTKEKYQRLFNKESGTYGMKSGHVILRPGESVGEHTTGEREEILVILAGKGQALIEKKDIFDIDKGIVLYVAPKTLHDIKNTGEEPLEYIFITSFA